MEIKYVCGDLFEYINSVEGDIIIPHVCNDQGAFGAGFVLPLSKKFPIAKEKYHEWSRSQNFSLGNTQIVEVNGRIRVCNMVAQTLGGKRPLYYNHLVSCLEFVAAIATHPSKSKIVAPAFGSGLAGGNWKIISELINDSWIRRGIDCTICYLPNQNPLSDD